MKQISNKELKLVTRKTGWGGLQCPCCNPWYGCKKHGKNIVNRIVRRILKFRLNKEVKQVDDEN